MEKQFCSFDEAKAALGISEDDTVAAYSLLWGLQKFRDGDDLTFRIGDIEELQRKIANHSYLTPLKYEPAFESDVLGDISDERTATVSSNSRRWYFRGVVRDTGKIVEGHVEADNEEFAHHELANNGIVVELLSNGIVTRRATTRRQQDIEQPHASASSGLARSTQTQPSHTSPLRAISTLFRSVFGGSSSRNGTAAADAVETSVPTKTEPQSLDTSSASRPIVPEKRYCFRGRLRETGERVEGTIVAGSEESAFHHIANNGIVVESMRPGSPEPSDGELMSAFSFRVLPTVPPKPLDNTRIGPLQSDIATVGNPPISAPSNSESPKVFISYRRTDSRPRVANLYDRLRVRFGREHVFMDVDTIPPGRDFVQVLSEAVSKCNVMLVVIGPAWLDARDEKGRLRLDDADDFVRIEIKDALDREIPVVPVLVNGAAMPQEGELPHGLKKLSRCNAAIVSSEREPSDIERLVSSIERLTAGTKN